MTETVDAAFADFVTRYCSAWNGGDFAAVADLWDSDCAEPWHFPEELDAPCIGWETLRAYLHEAKRIIDEFEVSVSDTHIKPLAADMHLFRFQMAWTAKMASDGVFQAPIGASVRVSGVLRGTPDGLRLVHYMEAGPAALPFVVKAYEQFAAPPTSSARRPVA